MSAAPEAHDVALMLVKHLRDVLRTIDTPSYDRTSLGDVLRYHIDAIERIVHIHGRSVGWVPVERRPDPDAVLIITEADAEKLRQQMIDAFGPEVTTNILEAMERYS